MKLCECGCGLPAPIAPYNHKGRGWTKGQPLARRQGHGTGRPLAERFWEKVSKTDTCWLWIGGIDRYGYGQTSVNQKFSTAHRASWILNCGAIPQGLSVLHKCDVRNCVRPDHLFLGTATTNSADMIAKKRHAYGERSGCVRLKPRQVIEIANARRAGAPLKQLSASYGISNSQIVRIAKGQSWKHLQELHAD